MATERLHLSIGEVLTLLQPEFPDITISKIRFLESQGLLDPERTPSGYRKFHDDDIERLRWILTQQRDHFLPLKVIKDRLATGDLDGVGTDGVLPLATTTSGPALAPALVPPPDSTTELDDHPGHPAEPAAARPPLTLLRRAGVVTDNGRSSGDGGEGEDAIRAVPAAIAGSAPVAHFSDVTTGTDVGGEGAGADGADGAGADGEGGGGEGAVTRHDTGDGHERARTVARLVEGPDAPEVTDAAVAGRSRRHPTGHTPGADPDGGSDRSSPAAAPAGAVALSLDELCAAAGLTAREVGELERYGLLAARSMGSIDFYDDDALMVARLAAGFRRYGIEPRHLRMYKVSAEREAGLFEQLITPLLKQRRPSARQEAVEMLEDLAELADDLRAAMVRAALREYLGES